MRVEQLGVAGFCAVHGVRLAYMTGAMANGIGSVEVVAAAARGGGVGEFWGGGVAD